MLPSLETQEVREQREEIEGRTQRRAISASGLPVTLPLTAALTAQLTPSIPCTRKQDRRGYERHRGSHMNNQGPGLRSRPPDSQVRAYEHVYEIMNSREWVEGMNGLTVESSRGLERPDVAARAVHLTSCT